MDLLDSVRAFVMLVVGAILVLMVIRFSKIQRHFSRTLKFFMWAIFFLLITVAWDTSVLIANSDPFSWRMLPLGVAAALCVMALAEPREALNRRYDDNSDQEARLKAALVENSELSDKLYEALRRENSAATGYQLC